MMIKNLWSTISFWCIHRHSEPVEMQVQYGPSSPFYACPKYFPQNRDPDERACANRLNFVDAEEIVKKLGNIIATDQMNGNMIDYTNFEFDYKSIHIKVLEYKDKAIRLGILNKKALR